MAEKQSQRDRIKEITDGIEQGIKDMFNSDNFRQYLRTMSRFHRYSLNNIILIQQQCPHATHVAGFTKWKNEFGRNVRKGEKGIKILFIGFILALIIASLIFIKNLRGVPCWFSTKLLYELLNLFSRGVPRN